MLRRVELARTADAAKRADGADPADRVDGADSANGADVAADRLFFAQVREDPRLELAVLANLDGPIAVVSSAGCTALSLLAGGATSVIGVDLNRTQHHLVELKAAAVDVVAAVEIRQVGRAEVRRHRLHLARLRRVPAVPFQPVLFVHRPQQHRQVRAGRKAERNTPCRKSCISPLSAAVLLA
jgi:hypothetical protein